MSLTLADKKWIQQNTKETINELVPKIVKDVIHEVVPDMIQNITTEIVREYVNASTSQLAKLFKNYVDFEIQEIKERISNLPTKDEMYSIRDEIITLYKNVDTNHLTLSSIVSNHEDRIHKLECQT